MAAVWPSMASNLSQREIPQWVLGATVLLTAVLLGAALVVIGIGWWVKRHPRQAGTAGGELAHFRLLYEQGELNREEYERIRSRLVPRLRKEIDAPAPPESPQDGNKEPRPSGSGENAP